MNRIEVPTRSGTYRWYYADVTAGDFTAVFIFMIGSIFSARYSAGRTRGAVPSQHAAVNFALYEKGVRRHWVLSEYPSVEVKDSGRTLCIGASTLSYHADGRLMARVNEREALWGAPVEATLELTSSSATTAPLTLIEGTSHQWHPIAPRAHARVTLAQHTLDGSAYHDGNAGEVPLGTDCRGWEWHRAHCASETRVQYRPWGSPSAIELVAREASVEVRRVPNVATPTRRTRWGLAVPVSVTGPLLESSPFYARYQGAATVGEVANFERFHRPTIRWMARMRTRQERAA